MSLVKTYHCDLCGEAVAKNEVTRVLVGAPELRAADCEPVDIGPCCGGRPLAELGKFRTKAREDVNGDGHTA